MRRKIFCLVVAIAGTLALHAGAQEISNLEAGRPVTIEDATPVDWEAFSASLDWAAAQREDGVNYSGPGLSLLYGAARNFELGAQTRWVTNPHLNARRGISSGDLDVHGLWGLLPETGNLPAIGLRADIFLPTGVASHGTNLSATALVTRSFEHFRVHGNFGILYVGDTRTGERRNRLFAVVGMDAAPLGPWDTDTLLVADVFVRQSVREGDTAVTGAEIGVRQRIGMQTLLYAGFDHEFDGPSGRVRYRGIVGMTHAF